MARIDAHDAYIENNQFVQSIMITIDDVQYIIDVSSTIDRLIDACVNDDTHNITIHRANE